MAGEFGRELRRLRQDAGLSINQFARRVHYSKGYLSRIENGLQAPTLVLARLCDAALGAGGVLVAIAASVPDRPGTDQPADDESLDMGIMLGFEPSGDVWFASHHAGLPPAARLLGTPLARGTRPTAPDPRIVALLRASFDHLRQVGMVASPREVLPSVVSQLGAARQFAAGSDQTSVGLRALAARLAEYAGWLWQELGQRDEARRWTIHAVRLASVGSDGDMASYALVRLAELALYEQDGRRAVELARRAQSRPNVDARVLGLAARCEAQGHALVYDLSACRQALDRADELLRLSTPDHTGGLPLGSSAKVDHVALAAGWALYELGRPTEAAEILDREVPMVDDTSRRTRARFGTRRALAHLANGEVEHACELLRDVIEDAAHVDSATTRIDLRLAARTLQRWHARPVVRELLPGLMDVMRDPSPADSELLRLRSG